jgi:hypothetical protein
MDDTGIKGQLYDARFLYANDRYQGALTMVLLAVAASSRRAFPNAKGDRERYTKFLGGRIRKLMMGQRGPDELRASQWQHEWGGNKANLEDTIYNLYRNNIIHEGGLPATVRFVEKTKPGFGITLSGDGNTFEADHGLLDLLGEVVEGADCRASLFGRNVRYLRPKPGVDDAAMKEALISEFNTSHGRFFYLLEVMEHLDLATIATASDEELGRMVDALQAGGQTRINMGAFEMRGLSANGRFLPRGLELLRKFASNYEWVTL